MNGFSGYVLIFYLLTLVANFFAPFSVFHIKNSMNVPKDFHANLLLLLLTSRLT